MTEALDSVFDPIAFEVRLLFARLDRAEEHFGSFREIWARYLDTRPHQLKHTPNGDGTIAVRLRRTAPIPVGLSVVFGELLYELRAALDNCLYAVAILVSDPNPPPNATRLEWPVRLSASEWKRQSDRYSALPERIIVALEAIQPYRAQAPEWNSLSILHDLARVDRHRSLHGLGLYLAHLRLVADRRHVEVVDAGRPKIMDDGDTIVLVRPITAAGLTPANFDLQLEFDVDVTDIADSMGPSGHMSRPWGPLDERLRSLIGATREYTGGLLEIAADLVVERR